ncbi:Phosphorylated_CTD interacting factor PCIF1 [Hexamita inflata]|uniref:Phosphorylated CTD interacting factor PCIF1 n=1 Tax=Hexamita inflata TaxID=28002 RepID=A0AA86TVD4_9EUKA|nr:Phosphorylated CTD interacting factor PCIF1 [Hexamita inflata]
MKRTDSIKATLPPFDFTSLPDVEVTQTSVIPRVDQSKILSNELFLAYKINQLRQFFGDLVSRRLLIQPPKDLINRWLFILINNNFNFKELLETLNDLDNNVIGRELVLSIPMRLQADYSSAEPPKLAQTIREFTDRLNEFVRMEDGYTSKEKVFQAELAEFKREVYKYTEDRVQEQNRAKALPLAMQAIHKYNSVRFKGWIGDIITQTVQFAERIFGETLADSINDSCFQIIIRDQNKIKIDLEAAETSQSEQFSIKIEVNAPPETHQVIFTSFYSKLTSYDDLFYINKTHLQKLKQLCIFQDYKQIYVIGALLRRYTTFFGNQFVFVPPRQMNQQQRNQMRPQQYEGTSFHAAVCEQLFRYLNAKINVAFECFASPLNCYFKTFCSAFAETDQYFNSQGSFFSLKFTRGCFEVNPPFTEEIIQQTVDKLFTECIQEGAKELVFVLIVPEWRVPLAKYHSDLENGCLVRGFIQLKPYEHFYISGDQQKASKRYYQTPHGSMIYVIANEQGFEKVFQKDSQKVQELLEGCAKAMKEPTRIQE